MAAVTQGLARERFSRCSKGLLAEILFGMSCPPVISATGNLVKSVFEKENGLEEVVFRRADHRFLQQAEAGVAIKELCRQHAFSDASFYNWRAKFGGMSVPDAKRLKELEAENAKLKRLLAESILDAEALKAALGRKR